MNMRQIISLFAILFTLSGLVPVARASHTVDVDTNETNYVPSVDDWTEYGAADVLSDDRVQISKTSSRDGYVYTDVDVSSGNEDDYALFVSFTRAEDPYSDLSSGEENIAGLPYLYAYFLDDDGEVIEYMQGSTMRQYAANGDAWNVRWGYMSVPDDTESMRLFLKQASRVGTTSDGRDAWFYQPALYFLDSTSEVSDVVDEYYNELDDVEDYFDNYSSNSSYSSNDNDDSDDDQDYPTGTLLKCSSDSDVYSMTSSNTLKLYPNEDTFYAWGNSFLDVKTISCSKLDDYNVSGKWTYERADYLVKFQHQAGVYTLDNSKYLRLIPDEDTARDMYGSHWTNLIKEYSESKMGNFYFSAPHTSTK